MRLYNHAKAGADYNAQLDAGDATRLCIHVEAGDGLNDQPDARMPHGCAFTLKPVLI